MSGVALATLTQFASYVRRDLDAYDATTADLLVSAASDAVTDFCGWHIAPNQTETLTVDGSGTQIQPLPTLYLTGVTALTEAGTTVDVSRLDWSAHGVLQKRSGALWTSRRQGVVATVQHGLAAPPGWLVTMVCAMAARAFIGAPAVARESSGGEQVFYASGIGMVVLTDAERRMLGRIALPQGAA